MFEELERQLGGKIKSVLILAMAAGMLTAFAGKTETVTSGPGTGISESEMSGNPIDAYFREMEEEISRDAGERYQLIYLECWEAELSHAYEMLGGELPASFFEKGGYGEKALRHFQAFAEAQGYLEGYYRSGIYGEDGGKVLQGDDIERNAQGTAGEWNGQPDTGARAWNGNYEACIDLTRDQTMRIYEEVLHKQEGTLTLEELFVFDGQEAGNMLKNSGVFH